MSPIPSFAVCVIRRFGGLAFFVMVLVTCGSSSVWAQGQRDSRVVPRDGYFAAFVPHFEGEYKSSSRGFRDAFRGGIRSTEGRWIDSICYHTMMGECYYQMGELGLALDQYDAALKLFLAHKDWMLRVQFPPTINPSSSTVRSRITWGASARGAKLGVFPDKMSSFQGRTDNEDVIRRGGVVMPPSWFPVRVQEIVRCTCLALRRRRELMGPACQYDPLSIALVDALARRPGPVNHWSQSWIGVELGLACACIGKKVEAVTELRKSLLVLGTYDHPLTATALLELGKLAFEQGQLDAAGNYFLEATFAAVPFDQADVIEEAFRGGLIAHMVSGKKGIYPPLTRAAPWARSRGFRQLQSSLLILAAESYAACGQTAKAAALLAEARRAIGTRDMRAGKIGARYEYTSALASFQGGNIKAGTASLASAMAFQKKGSLWLFHIALVDKLFLSGTISPRVADLLFADVLREPGPSDWTVDPMETLTVVLTPHELPMEHWFAVALERKEHEKALEIADRVRRLRFYSSLPMGGRLLSLRWILEAPKDALGEKALLQRQDLLVKYPKYAELSRGATAVRQALARLPLVSEDDTQQKQQKEGLGQWAEISAAQELILHEIAVRREPSEFVFPPLRTTKEIRESMHEGQLALAFYATSRFVYAFVFTNEKYTYWRIEAPGEIRKQVVQMLKAMGHYGRDSQLGAADLSSDDWQEPAATVLSLLLNKAKADFWHKYDELVVVPDGALWYLPFEALQVSQEGKNVPLVSAIRIRCVPTASMIVPDKRGIKPGGNSAVVLGKLHPQNDEDVGTEAFDDLRRADPTSVAIGSPLPTACAWMAPLFSRLVVLDDVDDLTRGPYEWAPAQIDKGKLGGALAHWFQLPWGAPDQVILPGFHTAAEEGLKRPGTGNEIFLTVCGLMSTGVRTVLLTRWRVGGQTDYDLVREFVQELPHTTASDAWQRAVAISKDNHLDPMRQPRLKLSPADEPPKAAHPFFWSGYLLVDTGSDPSLKSTPEPDAPKP